MDYFVYVLRSTRTGNLYKGMTNDINRRLSEHNLGKNRSTKAGAPWKLVYFERFATRQEARNREKFLKSGSGREFLKVNIPL